MSSDIKLEALAPKDDLLPEEGTSFGVYYKSLSSAFSNPKIRNIALSGSLGSGKSSIIRSFDRERNGKKRFLYVSLIDFSRAVANDKGKPYDQQQLEASLLDQILSYCTSDKVPESSIRGIPEKFEFLDFSAKALTLLGLSAFVLIFHEKFGKLAAMFGTPDYLRSNFHVMLYLFAAIVLCGFVYRILLRCMPLLQASKFLFKYGDAEAEVDLGKKQTSLDTHKFELAYILERIGEEHDYTVVFEDLERLDPATAVAIMSKLRELNALTNNHLQAQGNSQPIRFLYAISDSTMPAEYRTKFYDCIIPVIPVSHPLNSRNMFEDMLKELGFGKAWEGALCRALSDAFVDYRTLLNLRNEFLVLRNLCAASNGQCGKAASHNEAFLLAITAYKILLPEWFEHALSPQGDGILPDFSSAKEKEELEEHLKQHGREKALDAIQKLFTSGLLDNVSMRLIIGEQQLIGQWLKVILFSLDRDIFDKDDEARITNIIDALEDVFKDTKLDPAQEPYADFRNVMAERLRKVFEGDDETHFVLLVNSLSAVSRKDVQEDWNWGTPETASRYAKILVKLYRTSPGNSRYLKDLRETFPENMKVPLRYATNLFNLSCMQELPERLETINQLRELWNAFPDNQGVALQYAMVLVNLSYDQKLLECADTVALLEKLGEKYPDNQKIALGYAKGLVNLSAEQQLPERAGTVALLKELWETFPDNQEITAEYASGLFNLSNKQQLPERAKTIDLLKKLWETFQDNQEIAHRYAKGLLNLSAEQQLPELADTVALLKNLWETFSDDQMIVKQYAKSLVNLSTEQQLPELTETVALLKNLWETLQDDQEIAHMYAIGLRNLSVEQQLPECVATIALLKDLREKYPDNQEIALEHLMGLYKLTLVQEEGEIPSTVADIADLLRTYPGIIPEFREKLEGHLSRNPDRKKLYRPLLDLFDGAAAGS